MNRWCSLLSQVCAIILGIVFLTAAFSKIGDLEAFHQSLGGIAFLPFWLQGLAVLTIPGLELAIGLSLLLPAYRREGALLSVGLLVLFLILGIILNITGNASDCGCFKISLPTWLNLSGWWIVARNALFLLMAGLVWQKTCAHNGGDDFLRRTGV
jgi:triosephosphate isomerase